MIYLRKLFILITVFEWICPFFASIYFNSLNILVLVYIKQNSKSIGKLKAEKRKIENENNEKEKNHQNSKRIKKKLHECNMKKTLEMIMCAKKKKTKKNGKRRRIYYIWISGQAAKIKIQQRIASQ